MNNRFIQPEPPKKGPIKKEKERVMTQPGSYTSKELENSKKLNLKGGRH